jgi:DNA-binding LytR/AlgR family response regulator
MKNNLVPFRGRIKVYPAQVIAHVADNNYSLTYIKYGQVIFVTIPIKIVEKHLHRNSPFRTPKSFLINIKNEFDFYQENYFFVDMQNNIWAMDSRYRCADFKAKV